MKRTVIGVLLGVFLILGSYVLYNILTTRKHSPFEEIKTEVAGLETSIAYCRPYKKERVIFGDKAEDALQPWGQYWRLGANEATKITFSKDVSFAGEEVKAGSYVMYAIPNPTSWTIALNDEVGRWGYYEADHIRDVIRVDVPSEKVSLVEQLTIQFEESDPQTNVVIAWDEYQVSVPILPVGAEPVSIPAEADSTISVSQEQ